MAKIVLKDAVVTIDGNDLSEWCSSNSLELEVEDQDATTFTSGGWSERLAGLKSGTLSLTFKQDYATAAVDEILWPLFGEVVPFTVRPTSAVKSTTNPSYEGNVLISAHSPIAGDVGSIAEMENEYMTSGPVTRVTA